jgi:hypothetical protein
LKRASRPRRPPKRSRVGEPDAGGISPFELLVILLEAIFGEDAARHRTLTL